MTATMTADRRRLGEVLVSGQFITAQDLDRALSEQQATNERLGEVLVRLGILSEMELHAVLAYQGVGDMTPAERGAAVRYKLGELLLKARRVSKPQLEQALAEQERTNERLGEVLVRLNLISATELDAVLTWQDDHSRQGAKAVRFVLGEVLVASRVITREQLEQALAEQQLSRRQIGEILVEAGYVKQNQILEALRIQGKLVAASLIGIIGAAALTGCGTGASLTGMSVSGLAVDAKGNPVDNLNGSRIPYSTMVRDVRTVAGVQVTQDFADGTRTVKDVPWFHQAAVTKDGSPDNTCAQAAMSSVLHYWQGDAAPGYQKVVNESNYFNLATNQGTITEYLKKKGLSVKAYKNGSVNYLKGAVDAGKPVICMLQFEVPHYIVVVGYNEAQGTIVYHDSIDGPNQTLSERKFLKHWHNTSMKDMPLLGGGNYVGLAIEASR